MAKESKELKNLISAVNAYADKYKENSHIIVSVMGFKGKECECVDDRILIVGEKKGIILGLKDMLEQVKKDKEDFLVW